MKKLTFIVSFVFVLGCAKNPETFIPFIEGYWEISQVKKDNTILKEYNISTSIDYFKINEDLTGFRKKVIPKLDGTFSITDHETPISLKIENKKLIIVYTGKTDTIQETIANASKKMLTITNIDGFTYIYKPFEKLTFD